MHNNSFIRLYLSNDPISYYSDKYVLNILEWKILNFSSNWYVDNYNSSTNTSNFDTVL